jgi:hypothetical protein
VDALGGLIGGCCWQSEIGTATQATIQDSKAKSVEIPLAPSDLPLEAVFFTSDVRWKAVDRPLLPRRYARESVGPIQPLVRHIPNKWHVAKEAAGGFNVPALCTPSAPSRMFQ